MNETIKELALKAYSNAGQPTPDALSLFMEVYSEKFAELIVRECMAQCVKVEDDDELSNYEGGFRDGALLCYQEIKERFGVK